MTGPQMPPIEALLVDALRVAGALLAIGRGDDPGSLPRALRALDERETRRVLLALLAWPDHAAQLGSPTPGGEVVASTSFASDEPHPNVLINAGTRLPAQHPVVAAHPVHFNPVTDR